MKNMVFLSQKVDRNMIFTDYWKVLVLIFSGMGNTAFFEPTSWWKDNIYWLLKRSCFEVFGDGQHSLFLSQEVDGKMIFTDNGKGPVLTFEWWEMRSFLCQEIDRKMILTGYWEILVLNFLVMDNTVFFSAKMLMER